MKMNTDGFRITAKGWLTIRTGLSFDEMEKLWADLTKFVADQARQNGMPDGGLPCLVMKDGGICITAERQAPPINNPA